MDVFRMINKINKFGKLFVTLVALLSFVSVAFAGPETIQTALSSLCTTAQSLLGVAAVLLIILGAVVYAAGQMLGAETRARASVWATNMFIGAIIGILIYIVVPYIINILAPSTGGTGCGYAVSG